MEEPIMMKLLLAASLRLAHFSAFFAVNGVAVSDTRSQPTLQQQSQRNLEEWEATFDGLSPYSVKFDKCMFVKTFDEELAVSSNSDTVLGTQRFVVFRLCPQDCSLCDYNYGEYVLPLEEYLQTTMQHIRDEFDTMCETCQRVCSSGVLLSEDSPVDCDSCLDECEKVEKTESNGYIDATEFLQCQMIYDPDDDQEESLFAGPICASQGSRINIGVFLDEDCRILDSSKNVDDYLFDASGSNMKLSHYFLKKSYTNTCLSCEADGSTRQGAVNSLCQQLYETAGKCETTHGFDDGAANYEGFGNQLAQEDVVCDFISSIKEGSLSPTNQLFEDEIDGDHIGTEMSGVNISDIQSYDSLQEKEANGFKRELEDYSFGFDATWLKDYSFKFQGCSFFPQWNYDAYKNEHVRIATKRLARIRMCPYGSCLSGDMDSNGNGCSSNYGDYILDLNVFTDSYFESNRAREDFQCAFLDTVVCKFCFGAADETVCLQECYQTHGTLEKCSLNSTAASASEPSIPGIHVFMDCSRLLLSLPGGDGTELYIGPYCATHGIEIKRGVFTDNSCTVFADVNGGSDTFRTITNRSCSTGMFLLCRRIVLTVERISPATLEAILWTKMKLPTCAKSFIRHQENVKRISPTELSTRQPTTPATLSTYTIVLKKPRRLQMLLPRFRRSKLKRQAHRRQASSLLFPRQTRPSPMLPLLSQKRSRFIRHKLLSEMRLLLGRLRFVRRYCPLPR